MLVCPPNVTAGALVCSTPAHPVMIGVSLPMAAPINAAIADMQVSSMTVITGWGRIRNDDVALFKVALDCLTCSGSERQKINPSCNSELRELISASPIPTHNVLDRRISDVIGRTRNEWSSCSSRGSSSARLYAVL
jgi:hypothetical protein